MATIERNGRAIDLDLFEKQVTAVYPDIPWRKPLKISYGSDTGEEASGLGCRICIAAVGMKGPDVARFPKTEAEFELHLAELHPRPKELPDA